MTYFSDYLLPIVIVGVADGPWDLMRQFYDNIPSCAFDNFQVNASVHLFCLPCHEKALLLVWLISLLKFIVSLTGGFFITGGQCLVMMPDVRWSSDLVCSLGESH
jgi:hypothetical protein